MSGIVPDIFFHQKLSRSVAATQRTPAADPWLLGCVSDTLQPRRTQRRQSL